MIRAVFCNLRGSQLSHRSGVCSKHGLSWASPSLRFPRRASKQPFGHCMERGSVGFRRKNSFQLVSFSSIAGEVLSPCCLYCEHEHEVSLCCCACTFAWLVAWLVYWKPGFPSILQLGLYSKAIADWQWRPTSPSHCSLLSPSRWERRYNINLFICFRQLELDNFSVPIFQ